MQIIVKTQTHLPLAPCEFAGGIQLNFKDSDTIEQVKDKIRNLGMSCSGLVVKLNDSCTLSEYGLQQGSVVHTVSLWEKEDDEEKQEDNEEEETQSLRPEDYGP